MNKPVILLALLFSILSFSCQTEKNSVINLAGEWRFALDPSDEGVAQKWFDKRFEDRVVLPGSVTSNGKGFDVGLETPWTGQIVDSSFFKGEEYVRFRDPANFKIPFWLQPLKYYKGAAWYQKDILVPHFWKEQSFFLILERCHWESRLWIDGREAGMRNSLGTPHQYDLTGLLTPGHHRLTICIDNRVKEIDPGINSHSISDHTQTNWNGIIGKMYLVARPLIHIQKMALYPDLVNHQVRTVVTLNNATGREANVTLALRVTGPTAPSAVTSEHKLTPGVQMLEVHYPMGSDFKTWNEFHPDLYRMSAELTVPERGDADSCQSTFGMRSIQTDGTRILVNGQPAFLRGTLECAIFPKTGFPPTDVESWLRIFRICRAHGLNHVRFHSWCPPEAAFEAADLTGFYLHVECSSWANQSTTLGDGKPFDRYLYEESERMADAYGNHPSFCLMAYGNEPGGRNQKPFLTEFVTHWKNKDPRRIYASGAGWPALDVNDFLSLPGPRIQAWGEGVNSIINREPPRSDYDWSERIAGLTQPVVSHEIGQWCVYPNLNEIPKYDGVLRARNFEIFRQTLEENGMAHLADSFLLASGKLQALCYKADIEAALRTKDFGGFQLLDLHDFPGQGTALVGILDPFWDEKGYVTPAEFSRFCQSTVPLVRLTKHIYTNDETLEVPVEIAHFGDSPLAGVTPAWKVTDQSGKVQAEGKLPKSDVPVGNGFSLGNITLPLHSFKEPQQLTLELSAGEYSNQWHLWVYPARNAGVTGASEIMVTQQPDEALISHLQSGGTALLNLKKGTLSDEMGGRIQIGFSAIFWNTAWTRGQAPHTLGILCDPEHPALAEFPTEYHSNWQWWDAMSHSNAIILSQFPREVRPVVRVIDDWFTNRPLALILELRVGKGKLLLSGIDLQTDLDDRPEARQLLASLTNYITSGSFHPTVEVSPDIIKKLTDLP